MIKKVTAIHQNEQGASIVPWNVEKKDGYFSKSFTGSGNPMWKGGKINLSGYIYIKLPEHPNANSGGYMAEHRIVMEKKLNRLLTPNEEVHHINQNKQDNRIKNLELVIKKAHFGKILCPHCQKTIKIK